MREATLQRRLFLVCGLILIGAGLAANERVLARLLSPDGTIEATGTRLKILLLELLLLGAGIALILVRRRLRVTRCGAALTLLFSTSLSLACAEILLRAVGFRPWSAEIREATLEPPGPFMESHPELGYTHRPGRVRVTLEDGFTFYVTHDPDGWRITRPLEDEAPGSGEQLWIYGCSFTHGWSLSDDETYAWLLQDRMPEVEVRNFGVGGYGTLQSLVLFREALRERRAPRAVVVAYADFHDRRNTMSRLWRREVVPRNRLGRLTQVRARLEGEELVIATLPVTYREFPLQRRSALVAQVEKVYSVLDERLRRPERVTREILLEFRRLADEHGVRFFLVGINGATREMLKFAQAQGIPSVDISVDLTVPEHTNKPSDAHPSAVANLRYAERLHEFLRRELLSPALSSGFSPP